MTPLGGGDDGSSTGADEHRHDRHADNDDTRDTTTTAEASDATGAGRTEPGRRVSRGQTVSVPLTDDPSGPRIAVSGPDPASGHFTFWLDSHHADGLDGDQLEAALVHLLARL